MDEEDAKAYDFLEQMFRNYILQHWSRERLERFALHLLGDQAQTWWMEQQAKNDHPDA